MHKSRVDSESRPVPIGALLGDTNKLYSLARDKNPAARAELSKTIGLILEMDVSARESELVADVLIKLMRQAESDLRQAVSEQIAFLDNVPLRLILQLANDDIEIAKPVLMSSQVLGDLDLMYIVKAKTSEYWQAIATRENISDELIDVLADTDDLDTALVLVDNMNITLTSHALTILSDIAQNSETLALPLLRRDDVESDVAARLYQYVGQEIKAFISSHYDLGAQKDISALVDRSVQEFVTPVTPSNFMPDEYMIDAAIRFKKEGALSVRLMLGTLRRGHMKSFVAQFSVYIDMPSEVIGQILSQTHGQGLAIAAKASGIEKQDFLSIFMLTNKIWNHGRLVDPHDIKSAIEYYNRATPEMAQSILRQQHKMK
ncbi:MAG: hypothetical protein COA45_00550 [Zetaproteobacteria bacterium]|nr:MAG: hypothetical protein COA45_00550 [Zetaproteobacteria bacterium]